MAGRLAVAYIDIVGRMKPLADSLRRAKGELTTFTTQAKARFANLKRHMARQAKFIGLIVAGATILAMKQAVAASSVAEEQASKFRAVFKSQANAVLLWAKQYSKAVQRSEYDLVRWLSVLQDTFVPLGYSRKEAAEFSKTLVQLAIDLASFNDTAEADVINDLQSALTGMTRTMYKYGVIIRESDTKQKAYAMGLVKTGEELTNQAKVQARLQLILEGTTDAHGDAERTADSFANSMRGLKSAIHETAVVLGGFIKEEIRPAIPKMAEFVRTLKRVAEAGLRVRKRPYTGLTAEEKRAKKQQYIEEGWAPETFESRQARISQRMHERQRQQRLETAGLEMQERLLALMSDEEYARMQLLKERMAPERELAALWEQWGIDVKDVNQWLGKAEKHHLDIIDEETDALKELADQREKAAETVREMAKGWMSPLGLRVSAIHDRAAKFRKILGEDIRIKKWAENEKFKAAKEAIESEMSLVGELGDAIKATWEPQWMGVEDVWRRAMAKAGSVTYTASPEQTQANYFAQLLTIQSGVLRRLENIEKAEERRLYMAEQDHAAGYMN